MEEKITKIMKEILIKKDEETLYTTTDKTTIKYDTKNEFIFVSNNKEDLTNVNYTNYCDPSLYTNIDMYDLECLEDYSNEELETIYNILKQF